GTPVPCQASRAGGYRRVRQADVSGCENGFWPKARQHFMNGSHLEIALRRALHARGLRFYVSYRKAPGRPDVAFPTRRLAVFVDGDLWHTGRRAPDAWRPKIDASRRRDDEVNAQLEQLGWTVLRFTEHAIRRDLDACVEAVTRAARR